MPSWLALPPFNVPLFTATGAMSPAWQWYLYQIFTSAESLAGLEVLEAFDASSGDDALALANDALVGNAAAAAPQPIAEPLDGIRKQLAAIAETPSQAARLNSLEKLIWSLTGDAGATTAAVIADTHAHRANYPAANYPQGAIYFETDRTVVYMTGPPGEDAAWVYAAGHMEAATASRPAGLGVLDTGFLFIDTTLNVWEYWNGAAWVTISASTFKPAFRSIGATPDTITGADFTIFNYFAGAAVENLPQASTVPNQMFAIAAFQASATVVTLTAHAGDTINGGGSTLVLQPGGIVWLQSDGNTNWVIVGKYVAQLVLPFRSVGATPDTIASADFTIFNYFGGAAVEDLPQAATVPNQIFAIAAFQASGTTVTVTAHSGDTIDGGGATKVLAPGEIIWLQSDGGTNWVIIGRYGGGGPWTAYTPTVTPVAGMTLGSVVLDAAYQQIGKTVNVRIAATFTVGGMPGNLVEFGLPVAPLYPSVAGQMIPCLLPTGVANVPGLGEITSAGGPLVYCYVPGAVYGSGAVFINGSYEAA